MSGHLQLPLEIVGKEEMRDFDPEVAFEACSYFVDDVEFGNGMRHV